MFVPTPLADNGSYMAMTNNDPRPSPKNDYEPPAARTATRAQDNQTRMVTTAQQHPQQMAMTAHTTTL
ncbi:hypothetical protein K443DRAFT_13647 [Laccaria amethystina LaAM-08-1]|uniref:Uncharacterized protein n=1 Tax=Laccaria amethystina LaAM-08-1 TaxID=1095629 RepID=A0A0C9X3Z8_9AGAR|nr:hypothetical protein K443DRAFT_13647 [Laccaria amethystina LaAM-08-1]